MPKKSLFPGISNRMDAAGLGAALKELEISPAVLSNRLYVDRKTVTRWLNGETAIPGSTALLLNVAVEALRLQHFDAVSA